MSFALAAAVVVEIFDVSGRRIRELRSETRNPEGTLIHWNGLDAAGRPVVSGLYLCRVRDGSETAGVRFVVLP